jgi:hypothetical protein
MLAILPDWNIFITSEEFKARPKLSVYLSIMPWITSICCNVSWIAL